MFSNFAATWKNIFFFFVNLQLRMVLWGLSTGIKNNSIDKIVKSCQNVMHILHSLGTF